MRVLVNGRIYDGSASEIALKLRDLLFDPIFVPDVEAYIHRMQRVYRSIMEREMQLPAYDDELRARAMFKALDAIGVMEVLEDIS